MFKFVYSLSAANLKLTVLMKNPVDVNLVTSWAFDQEFYDL